MFPGAGGESFTSAVKYRWHTSSVNNGKIAQELRSTMVQPLNIQREPLRWIAAFSRPLVEERSRSNQGRNQQKATAMSIYRTTRKTIDFREMPIRHVPVSAHGALFFMLPRPDPMSKFGERYQEAQRGRCGEAQQNAKGRIVSNICRHADVGHWLIRGKQGSLTCGSWHFFFVYF